MARNTACLLPVIPLLFLVSYIQLAAVQRILTCTSSLRLQSGEQTGEGSSRQQMVVFWREKRCLEVTLAGLGGEDE